MSESTNKTEVEILAICNELADMLIKKNRAYGDSALNPVRVFSQADPMEQIRVRIDDKLSRIKQSKSGADPFSEDVEQDLLGYLVLHRIARKRRDETFTATYSAPLPQVRTPAPFPNASRSDHEEY